MTQEQAYATWWWEEGSGILPLPTEDMEEFTHRITQIAWSNAAYKERESLAQTQEPVGEVDAIGLNDTDFHVSFKRSMPLGTKLYTHPPQRTEQELVGTVKELFTNSAWDRLNVRGSTKVYLEKDNT